MTDDRERNSEPRRLPLAFDPKAERILVATAALEPGCIPEVMRLVRPNELYRTDHQEILTAIYAVFESGREVEAATIEGWLKDHGRIEHAGGDRYVGDLLDKTPTTDAPDEIARRLVRLAAVRRVYLEAKRIEAEAGGAIPDLEVWLDDQVEALRTAADVRRIAARDPTATAKEAVLEVHALLMERERKFKAGEESEPGLSTGFSSLDYRIGRMAKGSVTILGADVGVGKSGLGLAIACNVARRKHLVTLATLEIPREELAERALASSSGVEVDRMFRGELTLGEHQKLTNGMIDITDMSLVFDDSTTHTAATLRGLIRRAEIRTRRNVELLIVDYLQLMTAVVRPGANDTEVIAQCSKSLLALAKDLDIAVLAMAQFNRDRKTRGKDSPPQIQDLYGSSQIEKDARSIILLQEISEPGSEPVSIMAWVRKARGGGHPGSVEFQYRRKTATWFEVEDVRGYEPPPSMSSGSGPEQDEFGIPSALA